MAQNHRKLIPDPISKLCSSFCDSSKTNIGTCPGPCFSVCQSTCYFRNLMSPLSPSPPSIDPPPNKHHKLHYALIISLLILSTTFLLVSCYAAIYVYYSRRRRSQTQRSQSQPQSDETREEFLDADHGPVLDHPIWYIRTVGLQPSIINSITVCKYKRGDGLVEGTDCSVCLNEFQEDETLRLLPKCSHAFHIPCIDTWLRSHTNCPLCRAGIVSNGTFVPSPEPNIINSGSVEETHEGILENDEQFVREREDGVCELGIGTEEDDELQVENERKRQGNFREVDDIQPIRRSVSMDSISASKISLALANVLPERSYGNSENSLVKVNELNMGSVQKRIGGNQSLLRFMGSSSTGRSLQNGPISMKRSLSYSGKFLLTRYSRSRNSAVNM